MPLYVGIFFECSSGGECVFDTKWAYIPAGVVAAIIAIVAIVIIVIKVRQSKVRRMEVYDDAAASLLGDHHHHASSKNLENF